MAFYPRRYRRRYYGGYRRRYGFRRFGGGRFRRFGFRRRGMYGMRSGYRRPFFRYGGRGRYRGRAGRMSRRPRLVIQVPSDMLPPRPLAGGWARVRRRARF